MDKIAMNDDMLEQVSGGSKLAYVVEAGDTLKKLADKYHVSVDQLCKWNGISNPDSLMIGQKLVIKF